MKNLRVCNSGLLIMFFIIGLTIFNKTQACPYTASPSLTAYIFHNGNVGHHIVVHADGRDNDPYNNGYTPKYYYSASASGWSASSGPTSSTTWYTQVPSNIIGDVSVSVIYYDNDGEPSEPVEDNIYVDVNLPPTGSMSISPNPAIVNELVSFTAENCSDPDGGSVEYFWDSDEFGGLSTDQSFTWSFSEPNTYHISLYLTDDEAEGSVLVGTVPLQINNGQPIQYTITTSSNPMDGGIPSGDGTYNSGTSVTVSAGTNSGYTFVNWTENGLVVSTDENYTFTITSNRTLVANFTQQFTVTTSSNPMDGGIPSGDGTYNSGTSVTVLPGTNSGYTFVNWTENGSVVSTDENYTFNIISNRILTANFTPTIQSPNVIINSFDPLSGTAYAPTDVRVQYTIGNPSTNLITNYDATSTSGFRANQNVTISSVTINGKTYVKAVSNQTTSTPGIFPINGVFDTAPGKVYTLTVCGYKIGASAYLFVYNNTTFGNIVWHGIALPDGNNGEVSNTFTVPSGTTKISVGVLWSSPTINSEIYIDKIVLSEGKVQIKLDNNVIFTTSNSSTSNEYKISNLGMGTHSVEIIANNSIGSGSSGVQSYIVNPLPPINVHAFKYSCNITAEIKRNGQLLSGDVTVAAFVGNECRGIANTIVLPTSGKRLHFLTVYSNTEISESIVFKLFLSDRIILCPTSILFTKDWVYGKPSIPIELNFVE